MQSITSLTLLQIVNPHNKNIRDIPGLAPPAMNRKLLSIDPFGGL
jgi:SNARE protein